MRKFKKGDRVRNIEKGDDNYIPYGLTGTVLEDDDYPFVEWDENIGGHDANGLGKDGYCRSQDENQLELLEEKCPESKKEDENTDKIITIIEEYQIGNEIFTKKEAVRIYNELKAIFEIK